ncbi:PucR family transcriptional regulator [Sinosporangium siamense]|uniref:PucR family transcriptional regulator n=1 Tax=Sinosporangium siamense TaxID=1367973 RepID=A0A919RDE5_9ACTN|nr:PucR family transcriptional regulator [Sinosporangium siamense]GII89786.1 PucR family transcriptional regulator [Sinosporangium siamense]
MAPTLQTVVRRASLGLRVLAGERYLDRQVRWVAVSELEDPTPFLEGGELVLTTGMRMTADAAAPYVARLAEGGAAGLGFGVGIGHDEVPGALVEAASAADFPLVEVPRQTAFIAVGKVVSELLAAEQYDEISRAFAAQGRLTRAALRPEGTRAVVDRLAREIAGWAALLDEGGQIVHATAGARAEALADELARLRAPGAPASLALSTPAEHVVVHPLGGARRIRGLFAVGRSSPFTPVAHTIVNAAASLLTLALEQGQRHLAAERRVRTAVLDLLLAGRPEAAAGVLERLGECPPTGQIAVVAAAGDTAAVLDAVEPSVFAAEYGDQVVVLVPWQEGERVAETLGRLGPVGVGCASDAASSAAGLDQARRALAAARRGPARVVRFAELAGQGVLSLLDPEAASGFASALLAPLADYGSRADLITSLRAYLAENGHWDAAAQRLGVHRHTLRYRMRRVAELLGRDLDDPATRAELWIALSVPSS